MGNIPPCRVKDKMPVQISCSICGHQYTVRYDTYKRNGGSSHRWVCRKCAMNNMSDEQKQQRSDKISNVLNSRSDAEKMRSTAKRLKTIGTEEFKSSIKEKKQQTWANKSEEELNQISKRATMNTTKIWNTISSSDRKRRQHKRMEGFVRWYNSLTDEEKSIRAQKTSEAISKFWENASDEYRNKHGMKSKEWWDSLSDNERGEFVHSLLSASADDNRFVKKFISTFNSSHLVTDYHYIYNYPSFNNGIHHCWDFALFTNDTNELKCLIDLDGALYHADDSDYSGLQSKEEYDERRALSVPDGIIHYIITQAGFKACFERLVKTIMMNYDDYNDMIFNEMRSQPFPYPQYKPAELIRSFINLQRMKCDDKYHKSMSLNTRSGDRLIQHFHPSIWRDHRKGELSPYQAWMDDTLLRKCIENRIIYQTHLNPNKILQGFNVSKIAPKVSVFSAGRAKMIISKYLQDFDIIFDPFSGYSGRMLGAISLGKHYIGQDLSLIHVNESNSMINFIHESGIQFNATITCRNILQSTGEYPCLFTCPPYSDKEQWQDVPVDTRACDDWIDECIKRFKCKRYVFVVDNTTKYTDKVVDVIRNKSHFGGNDEKIIMIGG